MNLRFSMKASMIALSALLAFACGGSEFTTGGASPGTGGGGGAGAGADGGGGATPETGGVVNNGGAGASAGGGGIGSPDASDGASPDDGGDAAAGDSGSGGSSSDGGGGVTSTGGTPPILDAGEDCDVYTTWYPDADGDGYGSNEGAVLSCSKPKTGRWTMVTGDCYDDPAKGAAVHPNLLPANQYFSAGFTTKNGESFDFDCNGVETSDPTKPAARVPCPSVTFGACPGSGYVPRTDRSGSNLNLLCGSQSYQVCSNEIIITCQGKTSDKGAASRVGCR